MGALPTGLAFCQVMTAPALPPDDNGSPLRRAIVAGLLDAGVQQRAVAALWLRPAPGAALEVLIAGGDLPSGAGGPSRGAPLLFPLGATGRAVGLEDVEKRLAGFGSWVGCVGSHDSLVADVEHESRPLDQRWSASPLDDVAGYLTHRAFAWVVVCNPVTDELVHDDLDVLRRELFRLQQTGRLSEADAVSAERKQAWFRELSRAGTGGVWDISIAVGTHDRGTALAVASVLCTAAQQSTTNYRVRPVRGDPGVSLEQALSRRDPEPDGDRSPFRATTQMAAALVRPPETELPGVRVVVPPYFDSTPEWSGADGESVELGSVLDRFLRPTGPLRVGVGTLNRHTFVCGATGGGKSQTVRSLLESLSRRSPAIPWLVIEPAKAEYARMAGRLSDLAGDDVFVLAPGDAGSPPGSINPLEPASLEYGNPDRTFPLQSHADLVRALFLAAFKADEPFPQVLSRALSDCYEASGWDLLTGEHTRSWGAGANGSLPRFPSLGDLQQAARRVVDDIGYGDQVQRDVRGFVDIRMGSLRIGTPGRLFEGGHPLDFAALLTRNVVIELEGVTNDQDKAFVMGAVLVRLYEQLLLEEKERFARERRPGSFRHLTVIEEAHRLLRRVPDESPAAHSLELFASLLAEVRAYGEGIVVAEQIPSKLLSDVIKNTALKVVHRLPSADDREAVGATMNLTEEQSQYVVTLDPGTAAVFADGMDRPVLVNLTAGEEREDAAGATREPPTRGGRRRSVACGSECRDGQPCRLGEIRHAERLLDEFPELTFWMEVSCALHASGGGSPQFAVTGRFQRLKELARDEPRVVQCATAHAVEQALTARYRSAAVFFDPDELGRHLGRLATAAIFGAVPGEAETCADDRGRWRLGLDRFADLAHELGRIRTGERPSIPHPEIVRRAGERGVQLGDGDPASQLAYLESLDWKHYRGDRQRALLTGEVTPPLVLRAAAAIAGPGHPAEQLEQASARVLTWNDRRQEQGLLARLLPPAAAGSKEAG